VRAMSGSVGGAVEKGGPEGGGKKVGISVVKAKYGPTLAPAGHGDIPGCSALSGGAFALF